MAALLDAGLPLHGVAHITGGGVADNFSRVLKNGLGAVLDNLFAPLPAMQRLCELGDIDAETAYLYWNMGTGMLLVTEEAAAAAVGGRAARPRLRRASGRPAHRRKRRDAARGGGRAAVCLRPR